MEAGYPRAATPKNEKVQYPPSEKLIILNGMSLPRGTDPFALVETYGSPLYVYDAEEIRARYRRLAAAFAATGLVTRAHYAVKANMNAEILKLLRAEGAGADCASPGELRAAARAGFAPADISYTGNFESSDDLAAARDGALYLNLDSLEAFERLRRLGVPETLGFRVNPDEGRGAFAQINTGGELSKFGLSLDEVEAAYSRARAAGVKRFGLHLMPGSCILEAAHFGRAVAQLLERVGPRLRALGLELAYLDMGGGFGVPYRDDENELDVEAAAAGVARAMREACARHALGAPRLLCEPGRYLVATSGSLIARVVATKRRAERRFVGLDAGMTSLMRPALYGARHRFDVFARDAEGRAVAITRRAPSPADLCGPVCESSDFFEREAALPEVAEGDLVVFREAGAYGFVMSSSYNGRPRPPEVLLDAGRTRLIRERQSLEDL